MSWKLLWELVVMMWAVTCALIRWSGCAPVSWLWSVAHCVLPVPSNQSNVSPLQWAVNHEVLCWAVCSWMVQMYDLSWCGTAYWGTEEHAIEWCEPVWTTRHRAIHFNFATLYGYLGNTVYCFTLDFNFLVFLSCKYMINKLLTGAGLSFLSSF